MADGIGRTLSKKYGIYEGQFVNGVPAGWGSIIDPQLNHYEGYLAVNSDGNVVGHGVGVLYTGDKTVKGVWENGYLKHQDTEDKSQSNNG